VIVDPGSDAADAATAEPPPEAVSLVVGAAIVRDGLVLAARRTTPHGAAGRWELPGGKVEHGEAPGEALVREVREELGCGVAIVRWLRGEQPVGTTHVLRAALCRVTDGEPRHGADHDLLGWLEPARLRQVDWLGPDRPFLAEIEDLLRHVR
jgi:8-oxo-dGTP diphosphatase